MKMLHRNCFLISASHSVFCNCYSPVWPSHLCHVGEKCAVLHWHLGYRNTWGDKRQNIVTQKKMFASMYSHALMSSETLMSPSTSLTLPHCSLFQHYLGSSFAVEAEGTVRQLDHRTHGFTNWVERINLSKRGKKTYDSEEQNQTQTDISLVRNLAFKKWLQLINNWWFDYQCVEACF